MNEAAEPVAKRTRRKLKDRIAEAGGIAPTEKAASFSLVSRRKKTRVVSNTEYRIQDKPVIPPSAEGDFSTTPETVSGIRVHLGLPPKSHNLVDLQATYRPVLLQEDEILPASEPAVPPVDFVAAPAPKAVVRAVEKFRPVDAPAGKKRSVRTRPSIEWNEPHRWANAIRFGAVTAVLGLAIFAAQSWTSFVSEAKDAKKLLTNGVLTDLSLEKKNNGDDWQNVVQALKDLSSNHPVISSLPLVSEGLSASAAVSDSASRLAAIASSLSGGVESLKAAGAVPGNDRRVAIRLGAKKDPVAFFSLPWSSADLKSFSSALAETAKAISFADSLWGEKAFSLWKNSLGDNERNSLDSWYGLANSYRGALHEMKGWLDLYAVASDSGDDVMRRYLLVFQNPREIRATGGFMGAVAEVTFLKGELQQVIFPAGGPYDFQSGVRSFRAAPAGLDLIKPAMQLQDANWWPDFPVSAKEIARLYSAGAGVSVDGVIAVTHSWLPDWLRKAGDVPLSEELRKKHPGLPEKLTPNNVLAVMEDTENHASLAAPKAALADLMAATWNASFNFIRNDPERALPAAAELLGRISQSRAFQFYSTDPAAQALAGNMGITGEMKQDMGDFFGIAVSSVGGGKSSADVVQSARREVSLRPDGSASVRVVFARSMPADVHDGETAFVRFYVPRRATNVKVSGSVPPAVPFFSAGKNNALKADDSLPPALEGTGVLPAVISGWSVIRPGKESSLSVEYDLPATGVSGKGYYAARLWHQAGLKISMSNAIRLPEGSSVSYRDLSDGAWKESNGFFEAITPEFWRDAALVLAWRS